MDNSNPLKDENIIKILLNQMVNRVEDSVENSMIYLANGKKMKKTYTIDPKFSRKAIDRCNVENVLFSIQNSPLKEVQKSNDQIPVVFSVSMPILTYLPNAKIGICVVENDEENTVRSLNTQCQMKKLENDNLLNFQIKTNFPIKKSSKYFYYLAVGHQIQFESLLLNDNLRRLDESSVKDNNKIFDGLVLFADEELFSNAELQRLKIKTVTSLLGTDILWDDSVANFGFIDNLNWIFKSADNSYKSYYLEALIDEFVKYVNHLKGKREKATNEYLSVWIILYCSHAFSIECFHNKIWYLFILELLDANDSYDFDILQQYFQGKEDHLIKMLEKMVCNNLPESFYILTHLFFLKYHNSKSFYEIFKFNYYWRGDDQIKQLENKVNYFSELFVAEPDLCSVFINYFASKNTQNLDSMINENSILPRSSAIRYLNHLITNEKRTSTLPNNNGLIDSVMKLLMESFTKNRNTKSDLQADKEESVILLENVLEHFDTNQTLVLNSIKLNFYCSRAEKTSNQNKKLGRAYADLSEFEYEDRTILLIEKWLNDKFSSFALREENRLKEMVVQFDLLIALSLSFNLVQYKDRLDHEFIGKLSCLSIEALLDSRSSLDLKSLQKPIIDVIDSQIFAKFKENPLDCLDLLCEKCPINLSQNIISQFMNKTNIIFDKNGEIHASELILKLYEKHFVQKRSVLSKNLEAMFEKEFAKFKLLITKLRTGEIELYALNLLEESQVSHLVDFGNKIKVFDLPLHLFKLLIQTRRKEAKQFDELHNKLKAFLQYCVPFESIDKKAIQNLNSKFMTQKDINLAVLSKLCNVLSFNTLAQRQTLSNYEVDVAYFNEFKRDHIKKVDRLLNLDRLRSTLFNHFFRELCNETRKEHKTLSLDVVIAKVIPNAFTKWERLARSIEDNSIKLVELNNLADKLFAGSNERLVAELKYLIEYFKVSDLAKLTNQLFLFKIIGTCTEAARLIEQIRKDLEMSSNFHQLKLILDLNDVSNWTMANLNSDIEKVIKILNKCDSALKLSCLSHFANSIELVKWLRVDVRNLEGLKFLVNLTSVEINRAVLAKSLLEAGTAFAPLIFDLRVDSSLAEFMDLCVKVWDRLDKDRNIGEKLFEIKGQMATLRQIANQRNESRSDMMNLLMLIKENSCFKISTRGAFLNHVAELISLEYTNSNQEVKELNYEKIRELENSLILEAKNSLESSNNANQQEEDELVKYFVDFVDVVYKLASVYFKLTKNGCYLFENMTVKAMFDFNHSSEWLVRVEFNDNSILNMDNANSTIKCLKEMFDCMEKSLCEWLSHLNEIRENHFYINLYTTNQIIYLRQLLNTIWTQRANENPNVLGKLEEIRMKNLLSILKPSLTINGMIRALESSFRNAKTIKQNKANESTNELVNQFAQSNGFSVSLVRKAVKLFGVKDETSVLEYCMENHYSDQQYSDEEMEDNAETSSQAHDLSVQMDFNGKWTRFMQLEYNANSAHINLQCFAHFLDLLAEKTNLKRNIPGYLVNPGHPHLIVCSPKDQIQVVLSIYSNSFEMPLPSNEEVLFCHQNTTSDEVENFFRLAFKSTGEKIYCLANFQELSSENVSHVCKYLSNNASKRSEKFVLVCVCTAENAIASFFSKHRINPILTPNELIQQYLAKHLACRNTLTQLDADSMSVRTLISKQPGNGKSSYVQTYKTSLENELGKEFNYKVIRIKSHTLHIDQELTKFYLALERFGHNMEKPVLFHIDIAFEVFVNVDLFLFNLVIANCLKHSNGQVWRRSEHDMYLVEIMPPFMQVNTHQVSCHSILTYLPSIFFRSPSVYYYDLVNNHTHSSKKDCLFRSCHRERKYQLCCYYLKLNHEARDRLGSSLYKDRRNASELSEAECLKTLLEYNAQLHDASWYVIKIFVNFLYEQLNALENSEFTLNLEHTRNICARLLIMISNEFGLPSLNVSNNYNSFEFDNGHVRFDIERLQVQTSRKWENCAHPYIVFNADLETISFIGVYLDRRSYKFINPNTGREIETSTDLNLNSNVRIELLTYKVPIFDNFNEYMRLEKLGRLRRLMGLNRNKTLEYHDPDKTYELTLDNCLKLMAIFMRLKCRNPVVVMGETGCGKTRTVKFLSDLHLDPRLHDMSHLVHLKIHGGTSVQSIEMALQRAEQLARINYRKLNLSASSTNQDYITAILFFDEANACEHIGLIKEIMCDSTCNGRFVNLDFGLRLIAAINPYKKHSNEMIEKLEKAGLGFYKTDGEKIGHILMRQLVYRVQPLPVSMQPIVWDFGQLNSDAESVYIRNMLIKAQQDQMLPSVGEQEAQVLCLLLKESQDFMREQKDECSFVSLRDIERVFKVTAWFYRKQDLLFDKMKAKKLTGFVSDDYQNRLVHLEKAFVLALAACYHSCLYTKEKRHAYRQLIGRRMNVETNAQNDWVLCEMLKCQHVFLDEITLSNNIARNQALLENVYMMIICIELRIPLFIVGKPGSSKSLAKTIVSNAMSGTNSRSELFRNLKEAHFINFQCSPLTRPEMIVNVFNEAAEFQKNNDLERSVAVVNLDEIGLAEDSELMPLKALHSLLEDGTDELNHRVEAHRKVGVISISNWALDPAKMNRGLFVSRGEPDINELVESAKGICNYDDIIYKCVEPFIRDIAEAYLRVCDLARQFKREFFGLRDYYSLIKMLYWLCVRDGQLTWNKLEHAIKRNFNGLEIDTVEPFYNLLYTKLDSRPSSADLNNRPVDLICSALKGEHVESNSRYLLLITENASIVDIIQNYLQAVLNVHADKIDTIFGSSFRADLNYSEVCKSIKRIKNSMEVGNTVLLLNFKNIYESLYDALNQYYYEHLGQKFVYLGLGTQRVITTVHDNFRLIIIADKQSVSNSKLFPIPLVNRLEKHFLTASYILNANHLELVSEVEKWIRTFVNQQFAANEVFIGYHDDAVATVLLNLLQEKFSLLEELNKSDIGWQESKETLKEKLKQTFINCATADSIIRNNSSNEYMDSYFQARGSFVGLLRCHVDATREKHDLSKHLLQVTTHSMQKLKDCDEFKTFFLESLQSQEEFVEQIQRFISNTQQTATKPKYLVIQCDSFNIELITCARYNLVEQLKKSKAPNVYIVLLVSLRRENSKSFVGFQVGHWSCYHIDEIDSSFDYLPSLNLLKNKSLSELLAHNFDLKPVLVKMTHMTCSLIKDTNIMRTIERIQTFLSLCANQQFVSVLGKHLVKLQKEKETDFMTSAQARNWLVKEISDKKTMNEHSSLKRCCHNLIISKLSPLLAFVLSKIDLYSNMDLLLDSSKSDYWLRIFDNLKLSYHEIRIENSERKLFECKSDWLKRELIEPNQPGSNKLPNIPFFWLIVDQLNHLCQNYFNHDANTNQFVQIVANLFESTDLYKAVQLSYERDPNIIDLYIHDFVLFNCELKHPKELQTMKLILRSFTEQVSPNIPLSTVLPLIHFGFEQLRRKCLTYLQFSAFNPNINDKLKQLDSFHAIDLKACTECIAMFIERGNLASSDLYVLLNLVRTTVCKLVDSHKNKQIIQELNEKYVSLMCTHIFVQEVYSKCEKLPEQMKRFYEKVPKALSATNITVSFLNSVFIKCVENLNIQNSAPVEVREKILEAINSFYYNCVLLLFEHGKQNHRVEQDKHKHELFKTITDMYEPNKYPELKSFYRNQLIKLFISTDSKYIANCLEKWFSSISAEDSRKLPKQIAIMYQNQLESSYLNELIEKSVEYKIDYALAFIKELLKEMNFLLDKFNSKGFRYNQALLEKMAKLKCCLKVYAEVVHGEMQSNNTALSRTAARLSDDVKLFLECTNKLKTYYFIIKELMRKFGYSIIKFIKSNEKFSWLLPDNIVENNLNISDNYLMLGSKYIELKQAISRSFLDNNTKLVEKAIQANSKQPDCFPVLMLALYRNFTISYKSLKNVPAEMFEQLLSKLYPQFKSEWHPFVYNTLNHKLKINTDNLNAIDLSLLLVHVKYAILFSKSNLIQPLIDLINTPAQLGERFLPSMPQDSLFDVFNAVIAARANDNPTFYACPNGHPYVLFNCGKPWEVFKCKTCNANIGGQGHQLLPGNRKLDVQDTTIKGYSLQEASSLPDQPTSERTLNTYGLQAMRFFIHACLYFACDRNQNDVAHIMITNPNDKKQFFWNHMQRDLRLLARILNVNQDEIIIVLHSICQLFLRHNEPRTCGAWFTKEHRQQWENLFYEAYLKNNLSEPNSIIRGATELIRANQSNEDEQNQKLHLIAYEQLEENENEQLIYDQKEFWNYRPVINFDIFNMELNRIAPFGENKFLKEFVAIKNTLKWLTKLPEMIQFINVLRSANQNNLFKHYASSVSINDLMNKDQYASTLCKLNVPMLVHSMQELWLATKSAIREMIQARSNNQRILFDYEFSMNSKLSFFLPTVHGDGVICHSLLLYLSRVQNDVLTAFYALNAIDSHQQLDMKQFESRDNVISFEETDFLHLIQTNSQFDTKSSKFMFNFGNIAKQIGDKYLQMKPLVDLSTIGSFEYADDMNDKSMLSELEKRLTQESIDAAIQLDIFNQFSTIESVSECIRLLTILINYAKVTTGNVNECLLVFMKKIYQGEKNTLSQMNHIEKVQLKHLKQLMLLLLAKKEYLHCTFNIEQFELLNDKFKQKIENGQDFLTENDYPTAFCLLVIVYQLIVFQLLDMKEEDMASFANNKLKDILYSLEDYYGIHVPHDDVDTLVSNLNDAVKVENIHSFWLYLVDSIQKLSH